MRTLVVVPVQGWPCNFGKQAVQQVPDNEAVQVPMRTIGCLANRTCCDESCVPMPAAAMELEVG